VEGKENKRRKYGKEEENKTKDINLRGLHTYTKRNSLQTRKFPDDYGCAMFTERNVFVSKLFVNSIKLEPSTSPLITSMIDLYGDYEEKQSWFTADY
jgi:hypothetical protein